MHAVPILNLAGSFWSKLDPSMSLVSFRPRAGRLPSWCTDVPPPSPSKSDTAIYFFYFQISHDCFLLTILTILLSGIFVASLFSPLSAHCLASPDALSQTCTNSEASFSSLSALPSPKYWLRCTTTASTPNLKPASASSAAVLFPLSTQDRQLCLYFRCFFDSFTAFTIVFYVAFSSRSWLAARQSQSPA